MKLKAVLAALAIAAILPVAAYADEISPSDKANGARSCGALKGSLGEATFKSSYGTNADRSNAMGKCVSKWAQAEHSNRHDATVACKAESTDAGFAASHGGKTFAQYYGEGKKGANALNRCIASKRAAERAEDRQAVVNAARSCKAERKSMGADPFKAKYGSNADKSNAFGRCVAKLAQAQQG